MLKRLIILAGLIVPVAWTTPAIAQDAIVKLEKRLGKLLSAGQYKAALPLAQQLADRISRRFGGQSAKYGVALNNLGQVHFNLGKYSQSETFYRQAVALMQRGVGKDNQLTAQVKANLALTLIRLQRLAEAKVLLVDAIAIYKRRVKANDPRLLLAIYMVGVIDFYKGDYAASTKNYKHALSGYLKLYGKNHPRVVEALAGLTLNMSALGKFDEAIKLLEQQIAIMGKIYRPDHPQVARALHDLAGIYYSRGLNRKAVPLFERALTIRVAQLGPDHIDVARTLTPVVALYWAVGLSDQAEKRYRQAIRILERAVGPEHPDVASVMQNHGNGLSNHGRYEEAEEVFNRALAIRKRFYGDRHIQVAHLLNSLAAIKSARGNTTDARNLLNQALKIERRVLGDDSYEVAERLRNLGLISSREGHHTEAYDYLQKAAAIRQRQLSTVFSSGRGGVQASSEERRPFVNVVQVGWTLSRTPENDRAQSELADATLKSAQLYMQSASDRALSQMAARFATGRSDLAAVVRRQQDLVEKRNRLKARYTSLLSQSGAQAKAAIPVYREVERLKSEIGKHRAAIAKRFPKFAELTSPQPLPVDAIQRLLGPGEALVAFATFDVDTYVWVVNRDGVTWHRIAISQKELAREVASLRKSLDPVAAQSKDGRGLTREQVCRGFEREDPAASTCETYDTDLGRAFKLYNLLLGPVAQSIAGKRHVIVVPSGPLTGLPFHMLVSKAPPASGAMDERFKAAHWMIRDHAVTVLPSVPSLRALRLFAGKGQAKRPFIGIGDPIFTKPGKKRNEQTPGSTTRGFSAYFRGRLADVDLLSGAIPPLPDTADELNAVGKVLNARKRDIILGRKASEATLKTLSAKGLLDDYRVVHFATHGLVAGEIEGLAEPALTLSLPSRATQKDDGLLTASEVAQLKLNADWVVLSACNTAAGDKPGAEALSGLARSFFYSGTRALLVSHWPVVSEAAVQLTTRTFASLKADPSIGRAEALRRSMLSLIDEGRPYQRHPSYWAPFIIVGEGAAGVAERR